MAVADGMGGHQAGDVASNLALAAVADYLTADRLATRAPEDESGASLLAEAIEVAHRRVLEAGDQSTTEPRMGATLILARVVGDHLHTCHVGDVRCYLRTATGLVQITRDHSVVGSLVQNGQLTPEQARAHPNRHEVLQAVGMPLSIQPETHVMKLSAGDRVILCSDGLWEAIADSEIAEIVDWDGTMRQRAMQLVDRANEAGGHDNITVVLYEHELGRARRS
jgi:protein phosphatase